MAQETQPFDAPTRAAIQDVITHQLDAFQHGDSRAAEEFATPELKTKFPDPDKFFDMVKANYGALLNPKSTSFGETADSPHGPLQKMTIVAADGHRLDRCLRLPEDRRPMAHQCLRHRERRRPAGHLRRPGFGRLKPELEARFDSIARTFGAGRVLDVFIRVYGIARRMPS